MYKKLFVKKIGYSKHSIINFYLNIHAKIEFKIIFNKLNENDFIIIF